MPKKRNETHHRSNHINRSGFDLGWTNDVVVNKLQRMNEDKVITTKERFDQLEQIEKIFNENYPYIEVEYTQYSMFKYWVPKKGVDESHVIEFLRAQVNDLNKNREEFVIKHYKLEGELDAIKSKWWYKLFS